MPTVEQGRILGHEAVGTIVAVGTAIRSLAVDDRVIVPAISSCGRCACCKRAMPSHCQGTGGIGWIFGHLIDGTQAEYTQVPFAETSVHKVPEGVTDEQVLFLTDILPTGYEIGVQNGQVKLGDVVVVVGAGPVGLRRHPDRRPRRGGERHRRRPRRLPTRARPPLRRRPHHQPERERHPGEDCGPDPRRARRGRRDRGGRLPQTFELCTRVVRPGGVVANIGVHGAPATLHLEDLWIKNITITTGLVNATTVPMLMQLVRSGRSRASCSAPTSSGWTRCSPPTRRSRRRGRTTRSRS